MQVDRQHRPVVQFAAGIAEREIHVAPAWVRADLVEKQVQLAVGVAGRAGLVQRAVRDARAGQRGVFGHVAQQLAERGGDGGNSEGIAHRSRLPVRSRR